MIQIHSALMKGAGIILGTALAVCSNSCVTVSTELGGSMIPMNQQYDIFQAEVPIDDIDLCLTDSLSGYSSHRLSLGAIRDSDYGLTTRGSIITLVPLYDTLDLGYDVKFKSLHLAVAKDTVSVIDESQEHILQNVYVYALDKKMGTDHYDLLSEVPYDKSSVITDGIPVYSGGDSLKIDFSKAYGDKFIAGLEQLYGHGDKHPADLDAYQDVLPGIYMCTDNPVSNGGRINMFELTLGYDFDYYYITGNYAELKVNSEYDGVRKDTSFFFYFSPLELESNIDSLFTNASSTSDFNQYCQNVSSHQTGKGGSHQLVGKAGEKVYIEGGAGVKPVIRANTIRRLLRDEISKHGDPDKAIVTKATITMPFEFPDNYLDLDHYPLYLVPSARITVSSKAVTYANLTDTSDDDEDPGDLNRSVGKYAPDITYHAGQLVRKSEDDIKPSYDLWFLIMTDETETTTNSSSSEMSEYYNYLAYSSYYNSMYGSYNSSYYNNYYTYAMLAQMYSSSSTSTSTTVEMDASRYYKAILCGPDCKDESKRPTIKFSYALPKQSSK